MIKHEDRARIAHDLKKFLNGDALNEGDALIINKATNNIALVIIIIGCNEYHHSFYSRFYSTKIAIFRCWYGR
jgi:hypothetical protein